MNTILVPVDFSKCAEVALVQALVLARRERAELHLVHVLPSYDDGPHVPLHFGEWRRLFAHQLARERLDALVESFDTEGVAISRHLPIAADVAPAVLQLAEHLEADVVVVGAYGQRGFRRLVFGSTTQEIVRHAGCPVMTVREVTRPDFNLWPARLVVPVDFSGPSKHAFQAAKTLAGPETQIDLVHVVETPRIMEAVAMQDFSHAEKVAGATRALVRFGESEGMKIGVHVLAGQPAETLAQYVEGCGADLVVIATRGLSGFSHLLLGSVTERLLRLASCPVLTLRAETKPGGGERPKPEAPGRVKVEPSLTA